MTGQNLADFWTAKQDVPFWESKESTPFSPMNRKELEFSS